MRKELSIGNWVYHEAEDLTERITAIDFALFVKDINYFDNLKPIILDQDWLDKFGIDDRNFFGGILHKISCGYNLIFRGHLILHFEYVHQLQNFYTLKGEELCLV